MIGMNPTPNPLSDPDDTVPIAPAESDDLREGVPLAVAPPAPRRSGLRALGAILLVCALLGSGVGIGFLLDDQNGATATVTTVVTAPTATPAAPVIVPGEEPVADVAAALLPSMVQIDTAFGLGSGFFYEPGLILTAAHVVEGTDRVTVRYADGQLEEGTVLGTNAANDIAVVQVGRTDVPPAPLALDEELRVGQLAIAIGSPWGLEQTVTSGIVSAVDRPVRSQTGAQVLVQTDASINPGNSGGALADREGRVIGVNIQIFTTTGSNSGVGFAVPINLAHQLAAQIVAGTPIETAFLGVSGEDATGARAGALVTDVEPGGPADAAGIVVGDIVVAVDAQSVMSITDLVGRIRSYTPGETVVLDIVREGEIITIEATLGVRQEG
jgi:putative serine protease PepD